MAVPPRSGTDAHCDRQGVTGNPVGAWERTGRQGTVPDQLCQGKRRPWQGGYVENKGLLSIVVTRQQYPALSGQVSLSIDETVLPGEAINGLWTVSGQIDQAIAKAKLQDFSDL